VRVGSAASYVPIDGKPWRLSMGLRRLDPDRWLEFDEQRGHELRRKAALLREERDTVLAVLPSGYDASAELFDLVVAHLVEHRPELVDATGDVVVETATGARADPVDDHPIAAASLLVQEDLCVLEQVEGDWRLTAACVCFPSRWSLTEKLGCTLDAIHGPVPGFHDQLTDPATRFFDRLTVERPAWRMNWTLLDTPELHLPSPAARREPWTTDRLVGELWFRVERQTLRRLPRTGAIVFTIRTYVTALERLLDEHLDLGAALAATLASVPDEVIAYKGWSGLLGPLREALAGDRDAPADHGPHR
jgi:dimethylamine monooxygenase subunit A